MQQSAFEEVIEPGYIGVYVAATAAFNKIVNAVREGGRAVIAAVQSDRNEAKARPCLQDVHVHML